MMNLDYLSSLVEKLRKEAIGEPRKIEEKQAYEYQNQSAKVVAVLKLVRAAHGVNAMNLLCRAGLFIDFGAIVRCVYDCTEEVYFLLEEFPKASSNVDKFVKAFFANTIDGYLSNEIPPVPTKKIRSAAVRALKGDEGTRTRMENVYKAFCGYVHANYAHIMEVNNRGTYDFNLFGVPSIKERQMRMEHIELAANSVLHAAAFISDTLGVTEFPLTLREPEQSA
jgi:hypothetical protein